MSAPAWHPKTGTSTVSPAVCPCSFGPCGHCKNGDHGKCVYVSDPAEGARMDAEPPVAFLMNRRGYVPIFPDARGTVARFYLDHAGAHTWHCPCDANGHDGAITQPSLDLFGEVTA